MSRDNVANKTPRCIACRKKVHRTQWVHEKCREKYGLAGKFIDWPDWAKKEKNAEQNRRRSVRDVLDSGCKIEPGDMLPEVSTGRVRTPGKWRGEAGGEDPPTKPMQRTTIDAEILDLKSRENTLTKPEKRYFKSLVSIKKDAELARPQKLYP